MASQRVFQLGLRRAAAPAFKVQPAGRAVTKRYVEAIHRPLTKTLGSTLSAH